MPFTRLTDDLNVISALSDKPNAVDGLSASQLKAKFDNAAGKIKAYINNTLIPQIEGAAGAANIGITSVTGLASNTVQTALAEIAETIFDHHTRHEAGGADAITVTGDMLGTKSVTAAKVADSSRTQYIEAEVTGTWTQHADGYYYLTITGVTGLLSTDRPKVHLKVPETYSDLSAHEEAFSQLYDCDATADGSITFYAKDEPSVAFGVVLEVARI